MAFIRLVAACVCFRRSSCSADVQCLLCVQLQETMDKGGAIANVIECWGYLTLKIAHYFNRYGFASGSACFCDSHLCWHAWGASLTRSTNSIGVRLLRPHQ